MQRKSRAVFFALTAILSIFALAKPARCATYYIDFTSGSDSNAGTSKAAPWQRAPGMIGFTGTYTHTAGDQFIFRGGVEWPPSIAPWNNSNSGSAGNIDYYGVDSTWWLVSPSGSSPGCGAQWCNPIFNGGSNPSLTTTESGYFIFTGSYLTMDGLRVQNIGVSGTNQGNYGLVFKGSNITVENMILPVMSRIAIYYVRSGNASNITFTGNDISACSWGIAVATSAPNSIIDGVYIHDNAFHDFHPQIANGVHGDGIFTFGSGGVSDVTQYTTNEYVYNNTFYGDFSRIDASVAGMTAFAYFSATAGPVYVYNNHGSDTASSGGYAFEFNYMNIYPNGHVYIYNNALFMDTVSGGWEGFLYAGSGSAGPVPSLISENNIYEGGATVYEIEGTTTVSGFVSDYNDFYGWTSSGTMAGLAGTLVNYSGFKARGYEANGLNSNPLFISSTNLRLGTASPAASAGFNLFSVFKTDTAGNPRPSSGPWQMGAYQLGVQPSSPIISLQSVH